MRARERERKNKRRGRERELGKSCFRPSRGGSLGIVIRAGSASNEDNGIKAFGRYQTECTKPIVNSIRAISKEEKKKRKKVFARFSQ